MTGSVAVIGLGRFGTAVAATVAAQGIRVIAVDRDPRVVSHAQGRYSSAICGDGTDPQVLRQAGATSASLAVIAVRSSLQDSMMCTLAAAEAGIPLIWAAASTDRHARVLAALGAHHVIMPVQEAASQTARIMSGRPVVRVYSLGDNIAVAVIHGGTGVAVPSLPGIAAVVKAGGSIERAEPGSTVAADTVLLLAAGTELIGQLTIEGGI